MASSHTATMVSRRIGLQHRRPCASRPGCSSRSYSTRNGRCGSRSKSSIDGNIKVCFCVEDQSHAQGALGHLGLLPACHVSAQLFRRSRSALNSALQFVDELLFSAPVRVATHEGPSLDDALVVRLDRRLASCSVDWYWKCHGSARVMQCLSSFGSTALTSHNCLKCTGIFLTEKRIALWPGATDFCRRRWHRPAEADWAQLGKKTL
nr:hypothetical protein CFP56_75498 [Quercus suber]